MLNESVTWNKASWMTHAVTLRVYEFCLRCTMSAYPTVATVQASLRTHDLARDPCLALLYHCSLGKSATDSALVAVHHVERIQPACVDKVRVWLRGFTH